MDRLIQLQQRGSPRSTVSSIAETEEEDEEDVADFYQYVPRRKGDFPPVGHEPADDAPQSTRYEIVDREFEDDIPIYIVRPRIFTAEHDIRQRDRTPRSEDVAQRSVDVQDELDDGTSAPDALASTRLFRSRTTASVRGMPADSSLSYEPNDPNIQRVDLFDIYDYVTQRDLERFETHRFRNPKIEDFPVINPLSEASSVVAREERAHHRDEIKSVEPKRKLGRPFKKKKIDHGPMVVIGSPRVTSKSRGHTRTPSLMEVDDSEDTQGSVSYGANGHEDITPTIEDAADELDVLDMTTSLRGLGGPLGQKLKALPKPTAVLSQPRRSTRSISRRLSSSSAERQIMREAMTLPITEVKKRRGRPAKTLLDSAHLNAPQPKLSRDSSTSHTNSNMVSSRSTSRSTSYANKQTTMDIYLKAKSTVEAANVHPSKTHSQRTPRKQTPQPTVKTNSKMPTNTNGEQLASRHQSVQPIVTAQKNEISIEDDEEDEEDEYEISHIVLHDDSRDTRFYLVAWKGFPLEEATWLTDRELRDAPDVLKAYRRTLTADEMG
jgi:hypothetical protein